MVSFLRKKQNTMQRPCRPDSTTPVLIEIQRTDHFTAVPPYKPPNAPQVKSLRARSSYENDTLHVPANRVSRGQNLCMTVISFLTHTQRKKLTFSETALSFAVKVTLSTIVFFPL